MTSCCDGVPVNAMAAENSRSAEPRTVLIEITPADLMSVRLLSLSPMAFSIPIL
jgi:hypothetical protein